MEQKTKIICTIGPSSWSSEKIEELVDAGMNVARLNFSHGTHEEKLEAIKKIKKIRRETGKNIGILQDLGGPKIRTGNLPEAGIDLPDGTTVRLLSGEDFLPGKEIIEIPVSYTNLLEDIPEKSRILLDDGLLEFKVEKIIEPFLECRVIHGGILKTHKGVNFPGLTLTTTAPTEKDLEDLHFGLKHGVDFVALSFVQTADDILKLREEIKKHEGRVSVIAKLERGTAIENLNSILLVCDGVMVARGDLGIETDLSMIPIYQKMIVRRANLKGVIVITATQMLDSMIKNPMPTRAEVTDVANAIYDGSDAIMLSGETASGKYPLDSVKMMRRIADNVESNLGLDRSWVREEQEFGFFSGEMALASSVCVSAEKLNARLIVAHTLSGRTARLIAQFRPHTPIVAITPIEATLYQLSFVWGVRSILVPEFENDFLETVRKGDTALKEMGFVKDGDLVIISAGIPAARAGGTNAMKLHIVGESAKS